VDFTAAPTGSTSARLIWDLTQQPAGTFTVYRSLTAAPSSMAPVSGVLDVSDSVYNDYGLTPSVQYFYWLVDQNGAQNGPQLCPMADAIVTTDALDEAQYDALYDWAFGALGGLYPVSWRYQAMPAPIKPRVVLNVTSLRKAGFSDGQGDEGESLIEPRIGTVSVAVYTEPQSQLRGFVSVKTVAAGTYTITADGTPYSVVYGSAPASATQVMLDLQAQLETGGFATYLNGVDPDNQGLILVSPDPRDALTVTSTGNLLVSVYKPGKAMTLAQRLQSSLEDPNLREDLYAAGIGVGTVNDVNDISAMLDTEAELTAQFDFYINLAAVYARNVPVIDAIADVDGVLT